MIIRIDKENRTLRLTPENVVEQLVVKHTPDFKLTICGRFANEVLCETSAGIGWRDWFYYTYGSHAMSDLQGDTFSFEQTHRWYDVWYYTGNANFDANPRGFREATELEVEVMFMVSVFHEMRDMLETMREWEVEDFGNWAVAEIRKHKIDKLLHETQ